MEDLRTIEELEEFLYSKCEEVPLREIAEGICQYHNCQSYSGNCDKCLAYFSTGKCFTKQNLASFYWEASQLFTSVMTGCNIAILRWAEEEARRERTDDDELRLYRRSAK